MPRPTRAPPMPVPSVTITASSVSWAAPKRASAQSAAVASFSTRTRPWVRLPKRLVSRSDKRLVAPGQVRREPHLLAVLGHEARSRDTHGQPAVLGDESLDHLDQRVLDLLDRGVVDPGSRPGGGGRLGVEHAAEAVDDSGEHLGAADVHADGGVHGLTFPGASSITRSREVCKVRQPLDVGQGVGQRALGRKHGVVHLVLAEGSVPTRVQQLQVELLLQMCRSCRRRSTRRSRG